MAVFVSVSVSMSEMECDSEGERLETEGVFVGGGVRERVSVIESLVEMVCVSWDVLLRVCDLVGGGVTVWVTVTVSDSERERVIVVV